VTPWASRSSSCRWPTSGRSKEAAGIADPASANGHIGAIITDDPGRPVSSRLAHGSGEPAVGDTGFVLTPSPRQARQQLGDPYAAVDWTDRPDSTTVAPLATPPPDGVDMTLTLGGVSCSCPVDGHAPRQSADTAAGPEEV
jgi:hypothetical protein